MRDQPARRRCRICQRVGGNMITVCVADDGSRSRLAWIQPKPLLGKVYAAVPEDRVGDQRRVLLGGDCAFEEFVAKRAVGAEALPGWSGKDAGLAAGGAGLLLRLHGSDFEQGRLLNSLIGNLHFVWGNLVVRGNLNGSIAQGGKWGRQRWRLRRWLRRNGGRFSLHPWPQQPGQPAEHSRLR